MDGYALISLLVSVLEIIQDTAFFLFLFFEGTAVSDVTF